MVMAYRVERAKGYKIIVDRTTNLITGFKNDGFGIDISFDDVTHSEYFAQEHADAKGLRIVTFQMNENFWNAIKHLKKFGNQKDQGKGKTWLSGNAPPNLPTPTGSDGASLSSRTKKTALHFQVGWLPVLKKCVTGRATIEYDPTESFPAKFDTGEFAGWYRYEEIVTNGFLVDEDGWDKTEDDIGS